ncbi:hypothetical protein TNCT_649161 [Trichonephila clavata]|uniref:Uncharacterized protein n=1 Tax=Trichonephila clavata TaxID=2740835 RepID=A0A8X6JB42_TRICU|nr:hypothetical protein TNCT_649161 [Trichonephila clavata]
MAYHTLTNADRSAENATHSKLYTCCNTTLYTAVVCECLHGKVIEVRKSRIKPLLGAEPLQSKFSLSKSPNEHERLFSKAPRTQGFLDMRLSTKNRKFWPCPRCFQTENGLSCLPRQKPNKDQ